jgi:hypothetical protein
MSRLRSALCSVALLLPVLVGAAASADYVTFGNGWGSKWDDPVHGTPATVTWGFMPDGTTILPSFYLANEVAGGSDVGALRASVDATYGAGAFDAALARAFDSWHAVSGITFVGPVADPGLQMAAPGATTPDIRIGAFHAVPLSGFSWVGAVGYGPPGNDLFFPDPLAGDIAFNLDVPHGIAPGGEGDPIPPFFGNDLENLFLHELGHAAIGLGHPVQKPGEVMYVDAGCCDAINREPSPDDIAGAQVVYGASSIPACDNGIDDDRDGLADLADPGCSDATDPSERAPSLPCDDGLDDDGDGRADFDADTFADPAFVAGYGDPACHDPGWPRENAQCQNGVSDDPGVGTDFDAGESILGVGNGDPNGPDPQCLGKPWRNDEKPSSGCGLGAELAVALPLFAWARRRRPQPMRRVATGAIQRISA